MSPLLHIDSSVRGEVSVSRRLTARGAGRWRGAHPGGTVTYRHLPGQIHGFITMGKIIEAAGGHSITSDINQEWPHISMEAVIARAPQALLMLRGGTITIDTLKDRPGWDDLPAVKTLRVYYVDKRVSFPSPVAIDALEDLAKQFHP